MPKILTPETHYQTDQTLLHPLSGGLDGPSIPQVDPSCPCGREMRKICTKDGIQPGKQGCIKSDKLPQ